MKSGIPIKTARMSWKVRGHFAVAHIKVAFFVGRYGVWNHPQNPSCPMGFKRPVLVRGLFSWLREWYQILVDSETVGVPCSERNGALAVNFENQSHCLWKWFAVDEAVATNCRCRLSLSLLLLFVVVVSCWGTLRQQMVSECNRDVPGCFFRNVSYRLNWLDRRDSEYEDPWN